MLSHLNRIRVHFEQVADSSPHGLISAVQPKWIELVGVSLLDAMLKSLALYHHEMTHPYVIQWHDYQRSSFAS